MDHREVETVVPAMSLGVARHLALRLRLTAAPATSNAFQGSAYIYSLQKAPMTIRLALDQESADEKTAAIVEVMRIDGADFDERRSVCMIITLVATATRYGLAVVVAWIGFGKT
jgi:hypothetical protein